MASLHSLLLTMLSVSLSIVLPIARSQEDVHYTTIVETTVTMEENSTKEATPPIGKFESSDSAIVAVSESQEKVPHTHDLHDTTTRALNENSTRALMDNSTQALNENSTQAIVEKSTVASGASRKFERSHAENGPEDTSEDEVHEVQHTTETGTASRKFVRSHAENGPEVRSEAEVHEVQHTTETGTLTEDSTMATPPIGRFENENANAAIMNAPLKSFYCVMLMWFGWYIYLH